MKTPLSIRIQRAEFFLGLGTIVFLPAAGLIGYLWLGRLWVAFAGLFSGLAMACLVGWRFRQSIARPHPDIDQALDSLRNDCASLSSALGELREGKLDTQVSVVSQPIAPFSDGEAGDLAECFNSTILHIQNAAGKFNEVTREPLKRLCYVGADSYLEGRLCGELMGKALGGKGEVIVTLGFYCLSALELRRQGFESLVHEKYPGIRVVEEIETTFDLEIGQASISSALERYPNLAGIYVTDGAIPVSAARAVTKAGACEQVRVIGHDLVEETVYHLKQGSIYATLTQDLFAQGHDSLIHLFNYLATGWHPPQARMLTHLRVVTRENCDEYWHAGQGPIECEQQAVRLARPMQRAANPLRIAVQNRSAIELDQQLIMGAMAASAKLRPYNARVELIHGGTLTVKPVLETVTRQGFDALNVMAANPVDVPMLNRAVEAGLTVATYNVEPLSLRAWVSSLVDHTQELLRLGEGISQAAGPAYPPGESASGSSAGGRRENERHELVTRAIRYMQDNLESEINIADVARYVALDQSYFCRLFTEQTGRNPVDFLTDLRLQRAKDYLAQSGMSVMEVCVALGYSPSYFSRLFKARVGCTPGQYARQLRC